MGRLSEAMGRPFMPWQQHVVDVALEVDDAGRFVYSLVVVTVPRQSGKSTMAGAVMDHRAVATPRGRVWFTMQTQKDAVDWLTNEHWPLLAPFGNLCSLRRMAGSEHVKWRTSGGLVRPFPPNPAGLHGKTSDLVVVDECWAFDPVRGTQLDQGIVPTQATRPNAQVWKCSTAGDVTSTWWLGVVEQGRAAVAADKRDGVAFFEWSCSDDLDPTDPDVWDRFHPAYGRGIDDASMYAALAILGPDEFGRAYGNRWVSMVAHVIPPVAWNRARDEDPPMPEVGRVALGFDVALDRSDASIVAAWRDDGGTAHIEVADHQPGVGWLPDRLAELADRWAPSAIGYDAAGPAMDVADQCARAGLELGGVKAREYAAACAGFLELVISDPPRLRFRPNAALDDAASVAARRSVADAWAWGRRQSATSISALTAATVALWTYDHAGDPPGTFAVY